MFLLGAQKSLALLICLLTNHNDNVQKGCTEEAVLIGYIGYTEGTVLIVHLLYTTYPSTEDTSYYACSWYEVRPEGAKSH